MNGHYMAFPCGYCFQCKNRRATGWAFRLNEELKVATQAYFITLTYDTQHAQITPNGYLTLYKRDVQLWLKRLRKVAGKGIKYFLCGEYGSQTHRPHYHAVIFNCDWQYVESTWDKGTVHYGTVSTASIAYMLKYMLKSQWKPQNDADDRQPEFQLMSKGLGAVYAEKQENIQFHNDDLLNRYYLPQHEGYKAAMPRYYKQLLYPEYKRKRISKHLAAVIAVQSPMTEEQRNSAVEASFNKLKRKQNGRI